MTYNPKYSAYLVAIRNIKAMFVKPHQ